MPSSKEYWEIFAKSNFSIVLLVAQVNRKIESDTDPPFIKLPCVLLTTRETKDTSLTEGWQDTGFVFMLVCFFAFKFYKVPQEMCESNTKVTIAQPMRLTRSSLKVTNSPFWTWSYISALLFISAISHTVFFILLLFYPEKGIFADFGAHLWKFKASSNSLDYFRDLCTPYGPICHHGLTLKGWGWEDVDLYEKFVNYTEIDVFRAADPNLIHIYHPVRCDPNLPERQMMLVKD